MSTPGGAAERVLVVDDEPDLARLLVYNLREMGFETDSATTGAEGLAAAARRKPHVIVLDLMLPDLAGTDVCRRVRADPALADVGILMLTARGDDEDRVLGFEVGADDYVVKPYNVREVCLRVRALARRATDRARTTPGEAPLRRGALMMDLSRHVLSADGAEINLRPLEFKLLQLLMENPGRVYSREQILEDVWGDAGGIGIRTVDVHVRRLREQLGVHGAMVETVHGFGYKLREG